MTDRPSGDLFDKFESLINDERNREHDCRQYLQYAKYLLFREEPPIEFVYVETEYRGHSGDSDYVISGKVHVESGFECVRAYVWELKAPQCFIFKRDTENRLCPSDDLIQAENQLLHYYFELKGSDQFRDDFGVTHPDNVCLGGIIIGCDKTHVRGEYEEAKKAKLYEKAVKTRLFLYECAGIRLMTWDRILDQLCSPRTDVIKKSDTAKQIPMPKIPSDAAIGDRSI
ncbi:MAG: hypothetical protein KAT65_04300 [Methanophagales archaeon]|nr:hypothetical protein [Methanophagales archaeon]